jgi:hypothetical protein
MRVGIIQSCYAPWRGYFDFIDSVDLFVIYDDAQYSKGSWRNRHKLKTKDGIRWLTVPVHVNLGMRIDEVQIAHESRLWQHEHLEAIHQALETAPYFQDAGALWKEAISHRDAYLSALNMRLTQGICRYVGISTPIARSTEFKSSGRGTDRLVQMLLSIGATTYVSGPNAKAYLDQSLFEEAGIGLEYKTYSYLPYPQQWEGFVDGVTVLDLVANCGPESRVHLKSVQPNEVAIS